MAVTLTTDNIINPEELTDEKIVRINEALGVNLKQDKNPTETITLSDLTNLQIVDNKIASVLSLKTHFTLYFNTQYSSKNPTTELEAVEDETKFILSSNIFAYFSTVYNAILTKLNSVFVPLTRTIQGHALNSDVVILPSELGDYGVAELDSNGTVLTSQLPSYVDDVLEYSSFLAFPTTGESGKIYIALDTNITYRWGGSAYVEISSSLALGETSSAAYRGDRGKIAYDTSLNNEANKQDKTPTTSETLSDSTKVQITGNKYSLLSSITSYIICALSTVYTSLTSFNAHTADISDGAHSENNYTDSEKSTVAGNYNRSITNQDDIIALELDVSNKVSFDTTKPTNESTLLIDDNNNLTSSIKKIGVSPTDSEITKLFENIPKIANGFLDFDLLVYRSGTSGAYCGKIEFNFNFNSGALIIKRIDENLKYTKNSFGINYSTANDSYYFYMTTSSAFDYFAVQINTQITRDYGLPMSLDDFNFVGTALTELPASIVLSEYSSVNTNLISAPHLYTDANGLMKSAKTVYSYTLAIGAISSTEISILPFGRYTVTFKHKLSTASTYENMYVYKIIGGGGSSNINIIGGGGGVSASIGIGTISSTGFTISNNSDEIKSITVSVILEDDLADD